MDYKKEYEKWLNYPELDEQLKKELIEIKNNDKEIMERFYQNLAFGTAGLRGILGAGINRMNIYVVRRATQGLADYINEKGEEFAKRGVAIAYDSRHFSREFAEETALVLCANGIKAYLFDDLRPVPELSFTIRHLKTIAGIVITASHNPAKYNGYKAYWEDGAQIPPTVSDKVLEAINKVGIFDAKTIDKETALNSGLLNIIGEEIDTAYIDTVYKQAIHKDVVKRVADEFKVVYTPLHGSGNKLVRAILKKSGFKNVYVVKEQEKPDGSFPTVEAPNPEYRSCFDLAIKLAEEKGANFIIGTDPDADRTGVTIRKKDGTFVTLGGNQIGAMIADYILTAKKETGTLPSNGALISTIVSTKMTREIAKSFGVTYFETLTGFKFIGEKIKQFESDGSYEFLFGFEESYGYLAGTHARDKDAVVASMLVAEMAAYYYEKGMTLSDAVDDLYKKYGGFAEETVAITMEGSEGIAKIQAIMKKLRDNTPVKFGKYDVVALRDYSVNTRFDIKTGEKSELNMPISDVLYFELSDDISFVARPSGTEPKMKLYYLIKGDTAEDAESKLEYIKKEVEKII